MTPEQYRSAPGLNFSKAKHLLRSPAHFRAAQEAPDEPTEAMHIGSIAHALILEGKDITHRYAIKPEGMNFATKEGKAWRAEQTLPIIAAEEAANIQQMAESVASNPHAAAILRGCQHRETPVFASLQGVPCKALLDCHGTDGVEWAIADLKTTVDASPEAFGKTIANFDLDMQLAWYAALLGQTNQIEVEPHCYWIGVEKKAPFTCVVYTASPSPMIPGTDWMASGNEKVRRALEIYKECVAKDEWPQPYRGINHPPKPGWLARREGEAA